MKKLIIVLVLVFTGVFTNGQGLYNKIIEKPDDPEQTTIIAMQIHELLKQGKSETTIFEQDGYPIKWTEYVKREAKKLERQIYQAILDNPGISAQTILNNLSHPVLDVAVIATDVKDWSMGDPDSPPTFTEFKQYVISTYGTE